jgi:hypothetical protein
VKQGRDTRVDNPVRSPFTKSKDRNRSEDRKSIKGNEPNRTEQNRTEYCTAVGGRSCSSGLGENCGAG